MPTAATDASTPAEPAVRLPEPYLEIGLVGQGGMGRVLLVHDTDLDRPAAMKLLRAHLAEHAQSKVRFEREARITAQLDHPGVPSVLGRGTLEDGRPYYVMRLVQGTRLDRAMTGGELVGIRARAEVLRRLAEVVAYAHQEGTIHRDIKPANVLWGAFGEVVLLDWGLSLREGEADRPGRSLEDELAGPEVVGTPAWMAPERIRGGPTGPASDVYALGAILYQMLEDEPPIPERATLAAALRTSLSLSPPSGPSPLVDLCMAAIAEDAEFRPTAQDFGHRLGDWLTGARLAPHASEHRVQAETHLAAAHSRTQAAAELEAKARALLDAVPSWAPEVHKKRAWKAEDQAREAKQEALRETELAVQSLHVALSLAPDDADSRALLVRHHRRRAEDAARRGDAAAVSDHRAQIRVWGGSDAATSSAQVALTALPEALRVLRTPLVRSLRRFRRGTPSELGTTPLADVSIPEGPCVLHLIRPQGPSLRVAFAAWPGQTWPSAPPPAGRRFLLPERVPEGAIAIPPGWLRIDPDPLALDPLPPVHAWLDGFLVERDPVTHRRYLAFLQDRLEADGWAHARELAPRWTTGARSGTPLYLETRHGFALDPEQALTQDPDQPAILVDWHAARAFAAWEAERTGIPWRLPHELEWQRAAGVDLGWAFPWGPDADPAWFCMQASHPDTPSTAPVHAFEVDETVFGVRHMAGNVREWCCNDYARSAPPAGSIVEPTPGTGRMRVIRGGAWTSSAALCRTQSRFAAPPEVRMSALGFRLFA